MDAKFIGPFLGVNNRRPDFDLKVVSNSGSGGYYLRVADNVDVTNTGSLRRRPAATLIQSIAGAHSLFGTLLVRDAALYRVTLPAYSETLLKVLTSNAPMGYCEFNGEVYYSNGTDSGRISGNTAYPWGLPTPAAPAASQIAGGLHKGFYQVAVSYYNASTGEEGGVSPSNNFELVSDGALRVTLPGATSGATHVNIYCSTLNGSIPLYQGQVAAGTATYDLTTVAIGREAMQRYEEPLPAGTRLFAYNGRLCSVKGATLYYGNPYRPGYYSPVEGAIPFPADISVAVPNQAGVYVAADKTYFIQGFDLSGPETRVIDVLPYGAVPGTEFAHPNKTLVGWFGHKGIVLADPQGEVQAVMADNVSLTPPASGWSTVVVEEDLRKVVSCGWCLNLDNLAATTYSGYDFNSTSDGYALAADGIYDLSGTGAVEATIGLGKQNFGVEYEKRMPAAYVGGWSDEPMELAITTPGSDEYRYTARSSSATLDVHRIDPGKGLRANWFDLTLRNIDGSDFNLASVGFGAVATSRKI